MSALQATGRRSLLQRVDAHQAVDAGTRGRDRHQRIALATIMGIAARAITALGLVVAVPLVAGEVADTELGLWALLVSAVGLLGFLDLGLGNGLVSSLADAVGREDRSEGVRLVSAAVAAMGILAAATASVGALVITQVDLSGALGVTGEAVTQLRPSLLVFLGAVVLGIPLSIGQRIHMAYQQGWASAATTVGGGMGAIASVAVAAALDATLPVFVAAMLVPPLLANLGETSWVLLRSHRDLFPRLNEVEQSTVRHLVRTGFLFFILAIAAATAYQSDAFVIAHGLGAEAVTRYSVALRIFTVAPSLVAAVLLSLWPAYSEAISRGDLPWVRATVRRSVLLSAVVPAGAALVLLFVATPIVETWSDGAVTGLPLSLRLGLGVWAVVSSISTAISMYLNGAGVVKLQVVVALVMAGTNLPLSFVLVDRIGVAGPIWASVVTQSLFVLVPELVVVRQMIRRTSSL